MSSVVVKLFPDPQTAHKALAELKAKGYMAQEIGVLRKAQGRDKATVVLPEIGAVMAEGPLSSALSQPKPAGDGAQNLLAQALGVSPDTLTYYELGVSRGGVVISVHAEEKRAAQAREILRGVAPEAEAHHHLDERSPGFTKAHRMTQTDPRDAKLSGDFRQY